MVFFCAHGVSVDGRRRRCRCHRTHLKSYNLQMESRANDPKIARAYAVCHFTGRSPRDVEHGFTDRSLA